MLQVEKNLYEIQEQINTIIPYVKHILNPYYEYPRFLYHSTNGVQYINTQITPKKGTRIEMEFAPLTFDNSFIVGSDTLALYIKNGIYVFVVGNKLYTTNISVVLQEKVTIILSENGLTINNIAFRTSGVVDITSNKPILVGAGYDNNQLNTFLALNNIDDIVNQPDIDEEINEENLLNTLNSIDDEVSTYEGDILQDNGINSSSSKQIYCFQLSDLDDNGIRQYRMNLFATTVLENDNTVCCYYDMINNRVYKSDSGIDFVQGPKYIVADIAYNVLNIVSAPYGFILNSDDYWESTNKGLDNTYAICRLEFEALKENSMLQLNCINYAENNYDYGVFSNLDTALTLTNNDDTSSNIVYKTFKGKSMSTIQPVVYLDIPKGSHFIDIKFRKDSSSSSYNDSLQFQVVKAIGGVISVTKPDSGSYTFTLNSNNYYESNNKGKANSYALCKVTFILAQTGTVTFHCINYAESNYDFGILSEVDKTLSSSNSADSSNVKKSFKGASSSSVQNVVYSNVSAGEHFIYVKFRKDSSGNSNNDSLQFQVEIN